jgi:hypothetical protein
VRIQSHKDLTVCKLAYKLAVDIFELMKRFTKLSNCGGENGEIDSSVDFAQDCGYISGEQHEQLAAQCAEVCRMLGRHDQETGSFLAADHLTSDV